MNHSFPNPDYKQLPPGWEQAYDPRYGRWYYIRKNPNGPPQTFWELPPDLIHQPPPGPPPGPALGAPLQPQRGMFGQPSTQPHRGGGLGLGGGLALGAGAGLVGGLLLNEVKDAYEDHVREEVESEAYQDGYDNGFRNGFDDQNGFDGCDGDW